MAEYHTTVGKLADPEFRRDRARAAGRKSHSLDARVKAVVRDKDKLTPGQRAQIAEAVAAWPPLTDEQRAGLALLLHPGDGDAATP